MIERTKRVVQTIYDVSIGGRSKGEVPECPFSFMHAGLISSHAVNNLPCIVRLCKAKKGWGPNIGYLNRPGRTVRNSASSNQLRKETHEQESNRFKKKENKQDYKTT